MTARDLYNRLTVAGFDLDLSPEGKLLVKPASKLTAEDRADIKDHRDELIKILDVEHHRVMLKRFSGGGWKFPWAASLQS